MERDIELEIVQKYANGLSQMKLAKEYHVTVPAIQHILKKHAENRVRNVLFWKYGERTETEDGLARAILILVRMAENENIPVADFKNWVLHMTDRDFLKIRRWKGKILDGFHIIQNDISDMDFSRCTKYGGSW